MWFDAEQCVFVPVTVLVATALVAVVVSLLVEWRTRAARAAAAPVFRPVLVHDRSGRTLLRSGRLSRAARPKIRLVYPAGM